MQRVKAVRPRAQREHDLQLCDSPAPVMAPPLGDPAEPPPHSHLVLLLERKQHRGQTLEMKQVSGQGLRSQQPSSRDQPTDMSIEVLRLSWLEAQKLSAEHHELSAFECLRPQCLQELVCGQ